MTIANLAGREVSGQGAEDLQPDSVEMSESKDGGRIFRVGLAVTANKHITMKSTPTYDDPD